jgi:hypothetical protein
LHFVGSSPIVVTALMYESPLTFYPIIERTIPIPLASRTAPICSGRALRISHSTPEGEVNVVEPVNCMAKKDAPTVPNKKT